MSTAKTTETIDNKKLKNEESKQKRFEFFYYARQNTKLKIGIGIFLFFFIWAIVGPMLLSGEYGIRSRTQYRSAPPSAEHVFGTTAGREDVYVQFVYALRSAFLIGFLGGGLATLIGLTIGFVAGYKGGWIDEILMMLTNILLVIPVIALFLIIAAYLNFRGVLLQSIILGLIQWPWIARSVRSQTLTLKQRGYVSLSKISCTPTWRIIVEDIAANMGSYVVMIYIILFGASILYSSALDFIGLGPTQGISLGVMMQEGMQQSALMYGHWWWFFPPGLTIMAIVSSMYFMNSGLDEVFNPKLREL
ncbi:ABC transporter permease [Spirochaeta dissipatitropha]